MVPRKRDAFRHMCDPRRIVKSSRLPRMTTTDAQAAEFLNEVEARARHQGVVSHTVKVQSDQVHIAIVDAAIENGAT